MYMKPKDAWPHRQGSASMKRFVGLSLVPASQFAAWVSLLFAFPSSAFSVFLVATTTSTALFTSVAWQRGSVAAWTRATYQYHVNGTDTVGRSVDARGPVDYDSVGLTQARPNYV